MPASELLHVRAKQAVNGGAFVRARSLLDRARVTADSTDLVARIDLTRAYVEAETGDPEAGFAMCRTLLERQGLASETYGLIWSQLGLLLTRRGEGDQAMDAFAHAIDLLQDNDEYLGRALLNRGNVHLHRGDARDAVTDFTAAGEALRRAGLTQQQAKAEHNLGYARLLIGDLVGALQMIDEAGAVLGSMSVANRAVVEQDRAEILTAAGRPHEAIAALDTAASAYGSRRLRTFQAECELTLAWTLLREDPARARVVARKAARHFRGQASPARALRADAAALVAEIAAGARQASLLNRVDALVDDLRGQGLSRDATVLELQGVRVSVARGDLVDARARLTRVRVDGGSPVTTRLLWREVRAELAQARGDRRHARQHVRSGLDDLHQWQSSFGSLDLQSTLVGHGRDLATRGLMLALGDGDPALVFEWSERARALVGRVTPVRPPADEQVASDLTELRLLQGEQPGRRTAEARRVAELRQRVRQRRWYGEGAGSVGEPASLAELQVALKSDDAALVAHVVVHDRVTALVVTSDLTRVLELGHTGSLRDQLDGLTSDLTMAAAHRHDALAAPLRAALRDRLGVVAAQLVAPCADLLGERRVVLTPSGALAGTPWSLLPGFVGRPLTIPPSATRWLELRENRLTRPRRVGLVAGPNVARGEEEVARAAAEWPAAKVLRGAEATAAHVAELAVEVDVLHLAGHGRHTGENPLFSAVELTDGPWFGYDIDLLSRTPETVVLSACELGRVSVRSGEEAIGMSAAWLHAGARTVLSSPVLIADDVACETLARWHALVAHGSAPADALAEVAASADDVVPLLSFGAGW
ncbi:MAG: CHAT domain-containing protein [Marmoricola sp.]